jgi:hypothetical protein
LATQFWRKERPPQSITPPKSKTAHLLRISNSCNVSRHGKLFPPLLAQLCSSFETFD